MATFSQGIQLVSVTSISYTIPGSGFPVSFSVPAGHYAEASYAMSYDGTPANRMGMTINGAMIDAMDSENPVTGFAVIPSGGSITFGGGFRNYGYGYAGIRLFKNP